MQMCLELVSYDGKGILQLLVSLIEMEEVIDEHAAKIHSSLLGPSALACRCGSFRLLQSRHQPKNGHENGRACDGITCKVEYRDHQ